MKAITFTEYGSPEVLHLKEIAKPIPKDNEILVRVHATSVNIGDWAWNFKALTPAKFSMPFLLWLPSRLYFGISTRCNILEMNSPEKLKRSARTSLGSKGDPVFGSRGQSMGANAEYLAVPENSMVAINPNLSYEGVPRFHMEASPP